MWRCLALSLSPTPPPTPPPRGEHESVRALSPPAEEVGCCACMCWRLALSPPPPPVTPPPRDEQESVRALSVPTKEVWCCPYPPPRPSPLLLCSTPMIGEAMYALISSKTEEGELSVHALSLPTKDVTCCLCPPPTSSPLLGCPTPTVGDAMYAPISPRTEEGELSVWTVLAERACVAAPTVALEPTPGSNPDSRNPLGSGVGSLPGRVPWPSHTGSLSLLVVRGSPRDVRECARTRSSCCGCGRTCCVGRVCSRHV